MSRRVPRATWRLLTGALATAGTLAVAATSAPAQAQDGAPDAPDCAPGVELLGFSDALDKTRFGDTDVGGLSALAYDRTRDRYFSLSDNQEGTDARFYTLRVPLTRAGRLGEPSVRRVTTLTDPAGTPYTGSTFDGEGLVRSAKNELLAASETEPSIRRFSSRTGRELSSLPVPDRFRVAPAGQATANETFESLTMTSDRTRLFTATEGPLAADGTTADGRHRIRILTYANRRPGGYVPDRQLSYLSEPGQGVVELAALSSRELLVLERGFQAGVGNTVRIFRVSLTGAPDVSGVESLAAGPAPLTKTLVADLGDCPSAGATTPGTQANPLLDNFESLALGPPLPGGRRLLLLQSDDNFSARQVTRVLALAAQLSPQRAEPSLEGRAVLPAETFADGPPSGAALGTAPINGITPPFARQPVQGFSAVLDAGDGSYLAMPDNGFGAKANSADFLLRVYRITPRFKTATGGPGTIDVGDFLSLRDPDRRIPFGIVNGETTERLLTGADFDIESVRRDTRGDLWFGEEFGPFLLHTDATGKVLEAPFPLEGVKSPQNPTLAPGEAPTLPGSRGFEGTAISLDGRFLFASLEGALIGDPDQRRRIVNTFDLNRREYTGRRFAYRVEAPGHAIGDFTALDESRYLIIERDNLQGAAARFKRIFVVDLRRVDSEGFVIKREVINLLRVRDPDAVSAPAREGDLGIGDPFAFPFQTIESVLPLPGRRLLVLNDNNFPFSAGRNATRADDNEAIVVRVPALE